MRRSRFLPLGILWLFACALLRLAAATTPVPQTQQPLTCANCHESQARTQPDTFMGRALEPPGDNPVVAAHPYLTVQKGAYTWTIETHNGHSTYTVSSGTSTISVPVLTL